MHWRRHSSTWSALLPILLGVAADPAHADLLVDAGQRALLTVSIIVDGSVEKPQGARDEVGKWSTRRAFEATVELAADEPEAMSFSDTLGGQGGPGQALLADIQKQAQACGQDQAWRPVEEGARLEFSGSHEETLHTVFYTAARETTDCTLIAPKVSPELTKMDAASGEMWASVESSQQLTNLGVGFAVDVKAPLTIAVRWELKKI